MEVGWTVRREFESSGVMTRDEVKRELAKGDRPEGLVGPILLRAIKASIETEFDTCRHILWLKFRHGSMKKNPVTFKVSRIGVELSEDELDGAEAVLEALELLFRDMNAVHGRPGGRSEYWIPFLKNGAREYKAIEYEETAGDEEVE